LRLVKLCDYVGSGVQALFWNGTLDGVEFCDAAILDQTGRELRVYSLGTFLPRPNPPQLPNPRWRPNMKIALARQ